MSKYGYGGGITKIRARVKIRKEYRCLAVKPEALELDGKEFDFRFMWVMSNGDPYPDEIAWSPCDLRAYCEEYPDGPAWFASGDLEIITEYSGASK